MRSICRASAGSNFDFRCLPARLYRETDARSVNMGCRFAPGDYYAAEPCEGRAYRRNLDKLMATHPIADAQSVGGTAHQDPEPEHADLVDKI
jgi:hypothetical protein